MIPFNKPHFTTKELSTISQSLQTGKISGDGPFTKLCSDYFESRYQFPKTMLTTSCTDALEICALLLEIQEGDEVIMPSYTFVSSANPFILRGAKIVFADSYPDNPNIDPVAIEALITPRTKAIVVVHYAGIACDMSSIMNLAERYRIRVVEDAAQGIDAFHNDKPLGGIGDLGALSFHETKNIICGEGGLLIVNDPKVGKRAEIIREKGTNRSAFFRGEINKYGWVDVGSSFLPSDILAALLYAQLMELDDIQSRRAKLWLNYYNELISLHTTYGVGIPLVPHYARHNAHLFYLVCRSPEERTNLMNSLKSKHIQSAFHYQSLHKSAYFHSKHDGRQLPNADRFSECLVRLPLFYGLDEHSQARVIEAVRAYYQGQ
ncbi:MAG: dTDP-4-amino-4,6-dideoxygalactose transaminase [Candidatus Kapaibacterium sp.]